MAESNLMKPELQQKEPDQHLMKGLLGGASGTVLAGSALATAMMPEYRRAILVFLLTAVVLIVVAGGIYWLLRRRERKRKAAAIGTEVTQEFDKQSAASSDKELKARLEEMKRKFMLLIERLQAEDRNIYEMPWYLTIGPSGTGKSWVLKASGLEPLEESEWKKGTFLIDWWTSDKALVLDTAGGVVFGEDQGYDTPEWKSLLTLLRKHRPQCPINGVFVVIPSQLLWLKPDELPANWLRLEEYAEALRSQIRDQLQRALGVRFPIYFLVTQSDRLPEFREFADALKAEKIPCDQMLGWSNPINVGQEGRWVKGKAGARRLPEFDPLADISGNLQSVVESLWVLRLKLLNKYSGVSARTDDDGMAVRRRAAELFAFPDTIQSTLAPKLQKFVETVFAHNPNKWPAPPFLRGIYFTSALREGEVLDRHRVGAAALQRRALPGGADRQTPCPFFLQDVLDEKAFLEAWLVTPIREARKYLSERRHILIWSGIGAAILLLAAIGVGGWSFKTSVLTELKEWREVKQAAQNSSDPYWLPILSVSADGAKILVNTNHLDSQINLANKASAGLKASGFWSFRWLFPSLTLDEPRRQAQLKLFERGVIRPLTEAVRSSVLGDSKSLPGRTREELEGDIHRLEGAFLSLLELELCETGKLAGSPLKESRDRVVDGCVNYLLPDPSDSRGPWLRSSIKEIFDATYSDPQRIKSWPPVAVRQPQVLTNLIRGGFQKLRALGAAQTEHHQARRESIYLALEKAQDLRKRENGLLEAFQSLEEQKDLAENLKSLTDGWHEFLKRLTAGGSHTLIQAFASFSSEVNEDSRGRRERLRLALQKVNGASLIQGAESNRVLIAPLEIGFRSMEFGQPELTRSLTNFASVTNQAGILDAQFLAVVPGREDQADSRSNNVMDLRLDLYSKIIVLEPRLSRSWEKDAFNVNGQDTPGMIADRLEQGALESWTSLPINVVSNFSTGTDKGDRYSEILSDYVKFKYFETALRRGNKWVEESLKDSGIQVDPKGRRKPLALLKDVEETMAALDRMEKVRDELERRWRGENPSNRASPAAGWRTAIKEELSSTAATVGDQIVKDLEVLNKGFPLHENSDENASEDDVRASWSRALAWQDEIDKLKGRPLMLRRIPEDDFRSWETKVSEWMTTLKPLLTGDGSIRLYRVSTPWGDREHFESVEGVAFESANQAAGQYRTWKWGLSSMDADSKDKSIQLLASRGFTLVAKTVAGAAEKVPTSIASPPRTRAWTLIDLLRRPGTKHDRDRYYVPIEVSGDRGAATVWFMIQPVESK